MKRIFVLLAILLGLSAYLVYDEWYKEHRPQAQSAIGSQSVLVSKPTINTACPPRCYPDPKLTPGDILTTDADTVCKKGYATSVRNVSQAKKNAVYREYGIAHHEPYDWEIDHLISLELGGSNDIKNLWAELNDKPKGYLNSKDILENYLHKQVCLHAITLTEAQHEISSDWYLYAQQYGLLK